MAVWRFVNLNIEEARRLADLSGIEQDLEATKAIFDLLIKELQNKQHDIHLLDALTTAALVKHARSFKTGVRSKIPDNLLKCLSSELLDFHHFCINLRDKYSAHSVNALEENQVVAYLVPEERGPKGISSISVQQRRLVSLESKDINKLKDVCVELRKNIIKLIEAEKAKIIELYRNIPIEELYNQKDPPPINATINDVGKPRKSYGK